MLPVPDCSGWGWLVSNSASWFLFTSKRGDSWVEVNLAVGCSSFSSSEVSRTSMSSACSGSSIAKRDGSVRGETDSCYKTVGFLVVVVLVVRASCHLYLILSACISRAVNGTMVQFSRFGNLCHLFLCHFTQI